MEISRADAFDMLSKWRTESTPIRGLLLTESGIVNFRGCIEDLQPSGFSLAQKQPSPKVFDLVIDMRRASGFSYGDPREAPEVVRGSYEGKVLGLLCFDVPGVNVALFELAD